MLHKILYIYFIYFIYILYILYISAKFSGPIIFGTDTADPPFLQQEFDERNRCFFHMETKLYL